MKTQIEKQVKKMKSRMNEIEEKLTSAKLGTMDSHEHGSLNGQTQTLRQTIVELQNIVDFC